MTFALDHGGRQPDRRREYVDAIAHLGSHVNYLTDYAIGAACRSTTKFIDAGHVNAHDAYGWGQRATRTCARESALNNAGLGGGR